MSQLVQDIIGISSCIIVWYPLLIGVVSGLVFMLVMWFVSDIKTTRLRRKYYASLNDEQKKLVDSYVDTKWFFRDLSNK